MPVDSLMGCEGAEIGGREGTIGSGEWEIGSGQHKVCFNRVHDSYIALDRATKASLKI